jgi:hypothetical protein
MLVTRAKRNGDEATRADYSLRPPFTPILKIDSNTLSETTRLIRLQNTGQETNRQTEEMKANPW